MNRQVKRLLLTAITGVLMTAPAIAKDYFVATDGSDRNKGSKQAPFKTIKKALKRVKPGDTIYLRAGQYHEAVTIRGLNANKQRPITIRSYQNEQVAFNGTTQLNVEWQRHKGNIYTAKLPQDIWQLFIDGQDLTSARWPNGNWHDGSIWNKKESMIWPERKKSEFGLHYNKELSDFDFDLTGAVIVVNSGSFVTYQSKVTEHNGSFIKYDTNRVKQHFSYQGKPWKHGYFLEGKLGLLDEPGEWFYEKQTKQVYVWPYDSSNMTGKEVSGKVQSYALTIDKSSHIKVQGIDFFATTFNVKNSQFVTFEDTELSYPTYSKRMLGDLSAIEVTNLISKRADSPAYHQVRNCKISHTDGPALRMIGKGNLIENCLMEHIDYSCTYKGGYTLNMIKTSDLTFRRNTVRRAGCSEMFKAGIRSLVELNDLSDSGHLQNDGAMVQVSVAPQDGAVVRYNWVHDSVKQGIRFDNKNTPNAPWGKNGQVLNNVAWNTDRMFFKGDEHFIFNNLSFGSHQNDLIISSNTKIQGHNHKTLTVNNISNKFSGHRTKPGKDYPLPGKVSHNWDGVALGSDVRSVLRDPDNLDFRPKAGSPLIDAGIPIEGKLTSFVGKAPDIGPYEYGESFYWIPGHQSEQASRPVPPLQATEVKVNADLMWLAGYKASVHEVYFADSAEKVASANPKSSAYQGKFSSNIFTPKKLLPGNTYYWRVDAHTEKGLVKGQVWSFKVENELNTTQFSANSTVLID